MVAVVGRSRDDLFAENVGLVRHVLRHFVCSPNDRGDLYQVGCEGLLYAIDRFDPSMGYAFSSYAARCIRGYAMRHQTRYSRVVRVPENDIPLGAAAIEARSDLGNRLGRTPLHDEVAAEIGVSPERLHAAFAVSVRSTDDGGFDEPGVIDGGYDEVDDQMQFEALLECLDPRERFIAVHLSEGWSNKDIAKKLDLSPTTISEIINERITPKLAAHRK